MTVRHSDSFQKLAQAALIATSALVIIAAAVWGIRQFTTLHQQAAAQPTELATAGFPMPGDLAPDFKLIDQFGQPVTLSSLRGREVVLAFIDSRCRTLCPLTAEIMYDARARLGSAATNRVALVAINANPSATSVATVQAWSINHGMLHQWSFLTGTAQQLESVYHSYHVYAQVDSSGQDVHDPATFIIDTEGHERLYYETLDSESKADLGSEESGLLAGMQQWLPRTQ